MFNGRVRFDPSASGSEAFAYGGEQPVSAGLEHQLKTSQIARLFFSRTNVDALQDGIRYKVWTSSSKKLVIGRQSEVELGIVMRSTYLQNSKNAEGTRDGVVAQVRDLNALVLDYCVPKIVQEASMYQQFLRDASTLPTPMSHGEFASMKGSRVLEQKGFF
jgi:hypothetical protein